MRGTKAIVYIAAALFILNGPALAQTEPVNLGPVVNSPDSDFGPMVTADGDALYFTSDRDGGFEGQDIWMSRRVDGEWTQPENLGPNVNTKYNEGPDSFSVDGKTMYFTRCDRLDQPGICDIFTASWDPKRKEWMDVTRLPAEINSKYNDANASISYDGKTLYFVSDRPKSGDERGDWDIFVSTKKGKSWSPARRLGPPVNTSGNEIHVMIHPDGTLYFSSDGHGGFGGTDIFYARPKDGGFDLPRNMGNLINTPRDDMYFTIAASGDQAYLASSRPGGYGREDIYAVPIMIDISGSRPVMLVGAVYDRKSCGAEKKDPESGQPDYDLAKCRPIPGAVVQLMYGDEKVASSETGVTGYYQIEVPPGKIYQARVSAPAHKSAEKIIDLTADKPDSMIQINVFLDLEDKKE